MTEQHAPEVLAGAVVTRRNDLLVVRDAAGAPWSVPTSRIRGGETVLEASVRAVADSTGMTGLAAPFLGWYESIGAPPEPGGGHRIVLCYEVVVLDATNPEPGDQVDDARWMPVWEVSELPLADGLAELLAEHGVIDTLA